MDYRSFKEALNTLAEDGGAMDNHDQLAMICRAMEDAAEELRHEQPDATVTIASWKTAASVLWDIAHEL